MSTTDELERLEAELMQLNATVNQDQIVALADEALKSVPKSHSAKVQARPSLLSPTVQTVLSASRARQSQASASETGSLFKEKSESSTSVHNSTNQHEQTVGTASNHVAVEEEEEFDLPEEVGLEGKVRLQKARINVLAKESKEKTQRIKILEKKLAGSQASENKLKTSLKTFEKQARTSQQSLDRVSRQLREMKEKFEKENERVRSLESELREYSTSARKRNKSGGTTSNSANSGLEIRLNRALEELENQKDKYKTLELNQRELKTMHEKQQKKWTHDMEQQEKDKTELFAALRKQAKLIDILKRQKLHMEAARQLSFTEEEFVKILESAADPATA